MSGFASRRALLGGLAAMSVLTVPVLAATDPHVAYRERLHSAYAELRAVRPIVNDAKYGSLEENAATLAIRRAWKLADEVLSLAAPKTMDGLGVVALASAMILEGMASPNQNGDFREDDRSVAVARAILSITGEKLPEGFSGFGDEPAFREREWAYWESGTGHLPTWALEEAAQQCA